VSDAAGRCAPGGLAARLHLCVAAFLRDERGATAVEYGMIIACTCLVVLVTLGLFSGSAKTMFENIAATFNTASSTAS
ncbi:Flp family type IVb pilin, partial [Escherichia coli]|uniref:Flp family type IVb pilin n=1 Tax=Escherichia coli TaxID=562 RepID=UPI0028DEB8D6